MNIKDTIESAKLSGQGFKLMFDNNFTEAISKFDEALNIYPDSLLSLQGRALCKMFLISFLPTEYHHDFLGEIETDLLKVLESIKPSRR